GFLRLRAVRRRGGRDRWVDQARRVPLGSGRGAFGRATRRGAGIVVPWGRRREPSGARLVATPAGPRGPTGAGAVPSRSQALSSQSGPAGGAAGSCPVLGIGDRAASAVAQGDRAARLPLPESRRRAAAGPRRAVVGPRTVGEPAAGALRPAPPARRRGLAPR